MPGPPLLMGCLRSVVTTTARSTTILLLSLYRCASHYSCPQIIRRVSHFFVFLFSYSPNCVTDGQRDGRRDGRPRTAVPAAGYFLIVLLLLLHVRIQEEREESCAVRVSRDLCLVCVCECGRWRGKGIAAVDRRTVRGSTSS